MPGGADGGPPPLLFGDEGERLDEHAVDDRGLLVCLDFDGTLAPIVEDPADARMPRETRSALRRLRDRPGVEVAVVSGRSLEDLRERVDVADVHLAGNHGLELELADEAVGGRDGSERGSGADRGVESDATDGTGATDATNGHDGGGRRTDDGDPGSGDADVESFRPTIAAAITELRSELADVPGCLVEDKGLTASVHYRRTPEEAVPTVEEAVVAAVAAADGLRLTRGKRVFELRPDVPGGKDRAVRRLRARYPGYRVLFVGDDVTDEDAFEALGSGDLGVLVGDRPDTAAAARVRDPEAVADLLGRLADRSVDPSDEGP